MCSFFGRILLQKVKSAELKFESRVGRKKLDLSARDFHSETFDWFTREEKFHQLLVSRIIPA